MEEYKIRHNEVNLQFEIEQEDKIAYLSYRFYKKDIAFMHTYVPKALAGRGLATQLAVFAFAFAAQKHRLVMVYCPFIAKFITTHPQYDAQIDKSYRAS